MQKCFVQNRDLDTNVLKTDAYFDQHWNRAALSPDRVKGSPMTLATCGLVSTKDVVSGET